MHIACRYISKKASPARKIFALSIGKQTSVKVCLAAGRWNVFAVLKISVLLLDKRADIAAENRFGRWGGIRQAPNNADYFGDFPLAAAPPGPPDRRQGIALPESRSPLKILFNLKTDLACTCAAYIACRLSLSKLTNGLNRRASRHERSCASPQETHTLNLKQHFFTWHCSGSLTLTIWISSG